MTESMTDGLNAALEQLIPRAHQMGVRFTVMERGHVEASVPAEGNGNHFGVVYAGVTFTVAEVLGGAIHFSTFDASTHYPVVKRLEIDFLKPGTGTLTATARLSEAEIERITAELSPEAKVEFVLEAEVTREDGEVIARTRGDYQIRPFGR